MGIAHLDCCSGASFSGTVCAKGITPVHAAHVKSRQPGAGLGQHVIYMMTCSPLPRPEDLKPLIKTAIQIVTSPEDVDSEYAAIAFCVALGEQGGGAYLLLGLSPGSLPHMKLRDILLAQPDSSQDTTAGPSLGSLRHFWRTLTRQHLPVRRTPQPPQRWQPSSRPSTSQPHNLASDLQNSPGSQRPSPTTR